jgi:hypothetical protein
LDYFEKLATIFGLADIIMVMAFTRRKRVTRGIDVAVEYVKDRGYEFDYIEKESSPDRGKDDILAEVKKRI